jgi:hypothetical protein
MKSPSCQREIRESTKFCEQCGAKLEQECPKCKAKMPLASKFCGQCGQDLKGPEQAPSIDYDQPRSYTPKFLAEKIFTTRGFLEGERTVGPRGKDRSEFRKRFVGPQLAGRVSQVTADPRDPFAGRALTPLDKTLKTAD